jgi:hypothetical protein
MVDVQYNTALEVLVASDLAITNIDLTANTVLKGAELFNTNLTDIKKLDTTGLGLVYEEKTPYRGGKMMSIAETNCWWSSSDVTTNARNQTNGMLNMNTIKALDATLGKYPAFKWCADYGIDWYLPALDELKKIYNTSVYIESRLSNSNATLSEFGATTIKTGSSKYYWSSTENYYYSAYKFDFSNGRLYDSNNKDNTYYVRAVLAF